MSNDKPAQSLFRIAIIAAVTLWAVATAIAGFFYSKHVSYLTYRQRIQKTRNRISDISHALKTFEMNNSGLPQSLEALTKEQSNGMPPLLESKALNDSWGNAFHYKRISSYKFEIRSAGPDGQMESADDLTN